MLEASAERAAAVRLWVPGMSPGPMDAGSARAQEIARRREEMLGMLHDLPESEYELSLTDLVEKAGGNAAKGEEAAADAAAPAPAPPSEDPAARAGSGRPTGKAERRPSARRRDSGSVGAGSSFRSSSDGVLLNFYMPRSLTRSFTAPRPGRTPSISGGRTPSVASECNKRDINWQSDSIGPIEFKSNPCVENWHKPQPSNPRPTRHFQGKHDIQMVVAEVPPSCSKSLELIHLPV